MYPKVAAVGGFTLAVLVLGVMASMLVANEEACANLLRDDGPDGVA